MNKVAQYYKAVVGSVISGLTALGVALTDGHVTSSEIVVIVLAVLATPIGVAVTTNAKPTP